MFTVCSERGEFCGIILISLGDAYPPVLSSCPTSYFPCPTLSPPSSLIYTFYLVHRSFSYHTICSWPFAFLLPHKNPSLPTLHKSSNFSLYFTKRNKSIAPLSPLLLLHLAYPLVFPQLHNNQSIIVVRAFTPQRSITPWTPYQYPSQL